MRWVLDQDDLDFDSMQGRMEELRNAAHAVPVRRADGSYDILVEVDPVTQVHVPPPPPALPAMLARAVDHIVNVAMNITNQDPDTVH